MSRYHVPVPDYDFTIRQKNPYIPTPDYTLKYNKQKNRPSLNSIGTEFAPQITQTEQELPSITIPVDVSVSLPPKQQFNHRPSKLERPRLPRLPDENSNYPEVSVFVIFSFLLQLFFRSRSIPTSKTEMKKRDTLALKNISSRSEFLFFQELLLPFSRPNILKFKVF